MELYKHYPRECRDDWYFQGVKERIKNLFLEEKYPEKLNKEEEVLIYLNTLRYDANYSFLSLEDVYYNLKLTSEELKNIIKLTKETDSIYLLKRDCCKEYNPLGPYNFDDFEHLLNENIKSIYEDLHNTLLYTNEKQNFIEAIKTLRVINRILKEIEE